MPQQSTGSSSTIVFANSEVGLYCVQWLIENYKSDVAAVVTTGINEIYLLAEASGIKTHIFEDDSSFLEFCNASSIVFELGLLLWWPKILSSSVIGSAAFGFVNTHPSLLPYNRGKHPNFWALLEQCPFGVSLHVVDEGIDCGGIVDQKNISYTWEDNAETLYLRAIAEMKELFTDNYPRLRENSFTTMSQDLSQGSFHFSSELEPASRIELDKPTTARQLLNLLRARTFMGHPACSFLDDGVKYEVRIEITESI